jgi:hypothetical protein
MSRKERPYHKLLKGGRPFFRIAGSIFSRSCNERKGPALIGFACRPAQAHLFSDRSLPIPQVSALFPAFLLRFIILFARKPKNPV